MCGGGNGCYRSLGQQHVVFFLDLVALFKLEPRCVGLPVLSTQVSVHCAYMFSSLGRNKRRPGPTVLRYPDLKHSCYQPSWGFAFMERRDTGSIICQGTYLEFIVFSSFPRSKAFSGIPRTTAGLLFYVKYPPRYTV